MPKPCGLLNNAGAKEIVVATEGGGDNGYYIVLSRHRGTITISGNTAPYVESQLAQHIYQSQYTNLPVAAIRCLPARTQATALVNYHQ